MFRTQAPAPLVEEEAPAALDALPPAPIFFASRLLAEGPEAKVVEYCAVDIYGATHLMVTVAWIAEARHPGIWTPTRSALAAVLLIGQLFEREPIVVEKLLDDEVLQPLRLNASNPELIELGDILTRADVLRSAPDLDDEIAAQRFDPTRPDNAYGDALLLSGCWALVEERLAAPTAPVRTSPEPRPTPRQPTANTAADRDWGWWLGLALLVQILVVGALWMLPSP